MALRDVLIKLRLDDSQFRAKMAAAAASTRAFGAETAASGRRGASALGLVRNNYATLGLAAGAVGLSMVRSAANFDQAMANVNATGAATGRELAALREQALDFGRTTTYSATEAAGGIEALLKAGLTARDVMGEKGGLAASLALAAASNLDVEASAEAVSIAMQQFNLEGQQAAHVADLLAAGAGKSVGEVSDLSMALNQSGLVARAAGLSIEETVGTLSQFAAAGLIGSDAGTSFKTMLQRLAAPTAEAKGLLDQYNISAYDAQGNFVGMTQFAGSLQQGLADMSQEQRQATLATIFGSDAVRAATVLFEDGAKGSAEWATAVTDAGYAADVAATKTDTLAGDLDKLKNSWDAFASGRGGGDGLRPIIQALDEFLDKLGEVDAFLSKFEVRADSPWEVFKNASDDGGLVGQWLNRNEPKQQKSVPGSSAIADRNVRITADITDVLTKTLTADQAIDGVQQGGPAPINANPAGAIAGSATAQGAVDGVEQSNIPNIWADPSGALDGSGVAQGAVDGVEGTSVPINVTTNASSTARSAQAAMDAVESVTRFINVVRRGITGKADGGAIGGSAEGGPIGFAQGGFARGAIRGPGGPKQDAIKARLSNGEHVLTASDVRKAGGQDAIYAMRAAIQAGRLQFADGGPARTWAAAAPAGFASGGQVASMPSQFVAQLADNRVRVTDKGLLELIDDRVLVTVGAVAEHGRQSQMRRRG